MVSKKEGNSNKSMVGGGQLSYLNSRTRPLYFRRCKRRVRAADIETLPDELLSSILVRLPADYLHQIARLVCRRWSHIIRSDAFVNNQIQHSTCGLLISCFTSEGGHHPVFVTATQGGRVETCEFSYKCRSSLKTGCNGLVMDEDYFMLRPKTIYILNPATKQSLIPPSIPCSSCSDRTAIAFAAPSNKYKVTVPYWKSLGDLRLVILTLGVDDSWRTLEVQHLPILNKNALYGTPLITEGFMHWTKCGRASVLTLDVETETFTVFQVPRSFKFPRDLYYLSTGRFLSAMVGRGDLSWEVWGMKSETGEWKKVLPDIDLKAQKRMLQQLQFDSTHTQEGIFLLVPIGWVNYPEVSCIGRSAGGLGSDIECGD